MSARLRIAVVGAGPAGLVAAYDLARTGHQVTVFEGAPEVGGLASGFRAPHWDWSLEKYYHHWFASDRHILGLISELGWSNRVVFRRPYTVVYYQGKFQPLDSYVEAFKFTARHFSPIDLLRFGAVGLYLKATNDWQALEAHTADSWMRAKVGSRIYEALWKPLLVGKFGEENLNVVNMAWLWARIKSRTTQLGTFEGGFQAFMEQLSDVVCGLGVDVRLACPVTGIHKAANGVTVATASGDERFDVVISTSSPAQMARLAPDLPDSYARGLTSLKSMGAVVLILAIDRQLTPYYWHNLPKEAGFPFLALVEHTNFIPSEHYGGDHLIYCGDYLPPEHEYFKLDKEALLERFLPALQRFNAGFDRSWVKDSWLWRTPYAQPIPPVNHSRNIPALRTPIPGLYFASMSQVYPWDRGTNYAIEIGRNVARLATADFDNLEKE